MKPGKVDKIGTNRTASGSNEFNGPGIEVTKSQREKSNAKQNSEADRPDREA